MDYFSKYVNEILENVKPLTTEGVVAYCKKLLEKYYSERKLKTLEVVRDYIIENYIHKT